MLFIFNILRDVLCFFFEFRSCLVRQIQHLSLQFYNILFLAQQVHKKEREEEVEDNNKSTL